jgi:hypothetical protein
MNTNAIYFGKNIDTGAIEQLRSVSNVLLTSSGTLDGLSDVVITTPSNNQILKYTSPNWVNGSLSLDNLSDVVITSPATNNFLQYDGTNWVNSPRDYITFNSFGTTQPAIYTGASDKLPLVSSSTFWSGTAPNPNNNTNGQITTQRDNSSSQVYNPTTGFITLVSTKRYMITATINLNGSNINSATNWEWAIKNASSGSVVNFSPNFVNVGAMIVDFAGTGITVSAVITGCSAFTCTLRAQTQQVAASQGTDCNISIQVIEL